MGTSNSGCMWWGDIMLVLSMELGTPSRFIHNHFFLFKSVVVLPYFCSILTSFKKELNFKSKDFDLFPSSIQNLKVFCCLWSHHQENREHSKAKTQGHGVGSCRDPACVTWPKPPKTQGSILGLWLLLLILSGEVCAFQELWWQRTPLPRAPPPVPPRLNLRAFPCQILLTGL